MAEIAPLSQVDQILLHHFIAEPIIPLRRGLHSRGSEMSQVPPPRGLPDGISPPPADLQSPKRIVELLSPLTGPLPGAPCSFGCQVKGGVADLLEVLERWHRAEQRANVAIAGNEEAEETNDDEVNALAPLTDEEVTKRIARMNQSLAPMGFRIADVAVPYDGSELPVRVFGLVNTLADEFSRGGSMHSAYELKYFGSVFESILLAHGMLTATDAINKVPHTLTKARGQQLLRQWVREEWFELVESPEGSRYTVGVRGQLELLPTYGESFYPQHGMDQPTCTLCQELALRGTMCSTDNCSTRLCPSCTIQWYADDRETVCISCKAPWPLTDAQRAQIEKKREEARAKRAAVEAGAVALDDDEEDDGLGEAEDAADEARRPARRRRVSEPDSPSPRAALRARAALPRRRRR